MKHFYAFALLAFATLPASAAWDGSWAQWTKGDGSERSPYIIENEQQFAFFQISVSDGESYNGKFFRLDADLDMGADDGRVIQPVGIFDDYSTDNNEYYQNSVVFEGTFDGNFHTIDNMTVQYADYDELGGIGVFAVANANTVIKNLRLGAKVLVDASESYSVGGIVGYSNGATIADCSNAGTVNGGGGEVGGIAGTCMPGTVVSGCVNIGLVNGNTSCGGIIGYGVETNVTNCFSSAKVVSPAGYEVGGIAGWLYKAAVSNCVTIGYVDTQVGSIWMPGKSPVCAELEQSTASACYYVESLTGCNPIAAQAGVTAVSEAELRDGTVLSGVNTDGVWCAADDGTPTLAWTFSTPASVAGVTPAASAVKVAGGRIVVAAENAALTVADLQGRIVFRGLARGEVSFAPEAPGVYIVSILTDALAPEVVKVVI